MGKKVNWLIPLPYGWMGVGCMLISAAYNGVNQFYPLTKYEFISQDVARILFWLSVVLGILGIIFIIIAIIKRRDVKNMTEDEKSTIIKDSKFHAKVTNSEKASALDVNNPSVLLNVEAHLEANNVKDAAAFRSGQGISAILTKCQYCGKGIPLALTGKPSGKVRVECPHCHVMNELDITY